MLDRRHRLAEDELKGLEMRLKAIEALPRQRVEKAIPGLRVG
jgi:hypothetical protein